MKNDGMDPRRSKKGGILLHFLLKPTERGKADEVGERDETKILSTRNCSFFFFFLN